MLKSLEEAETIAENYVSVHYPKLTGKAVIVNTELKSIGTLQVYEITFQLYAPESDNYRFFMTLQVNAEDGDLVGKRVYGRDG
jgi:hypothetical protein